MGARAKDYCERHSPALPYGGGASEHRVLPILEPL
jgi:hypothetical protein